MKPLLIGGIALLAASSLTAQTKMIVHPSNHKNIEGYSYEAYNHLSYGLSRMQYSYESWDIKNQLPKGAKINALGIRPDGNVASTGYKVQMELRFGHSDLAMEKVSNTFDSNYAGSSKTTVISKAVIDLPGILKGTVPSNSWVKLPFDKTFTYDGNSGLVWESLIYANSNQNKYWAYYMDYARYLSPTETFGKACASGGSLTSGNATLGSNWYIYLSKAPATTPVALMLGASKTKLLGTINLPFSLDPLGMKGCYQHVDMTAIFAVGATNSGGALNMYFPIPTDLKLANQKLYVQTWALDLFANAAGWVTSNGAGVTLGAYPRQTLVSGVGDPTKLTTGGVYRNRGLVTGFYYQ
jgi:hypothetical protein